jgi:transposase
MIRKVSHTLKFVTNFKKSKLDDFFKEYSRLVNSFIALYWTNGLPKTSKVNSKMYKQINSWLMGKARKCAVSQAIKIIKTTVKKDKQKTYKQYKKTFSKAKKKDKKWDLATKKWSEWSKDKKFRHRIKMPKFKGNTVDLTSDLAKIQKNKKSTKFDLWIRLGSIFGDKFSLILPTKHHKRSRHYENLGFIQKKSITLRKHNNNYLIDLYWEKETEEAKTKSNVLAVDIGINKLLTTNEGDKLGVELKSKLEKLNRKKQGSKRWKRTCTEIKDYIGYTTNKIPWDKIDVLVLENLINITKDTRGKINKTVRKMLGHWNIDLLYRRIMDKAERNRVFLAFVEPAYSSQTCFSCKEVHKESRVGEMYKCICCGYTADADINAANNIFQRFLDGEFTVSRSMERARL